MDYELSGLRQKLELAEASGKDVTSNRAAPDNETEVPNLVVIGVGKGRAQASVRRLLEEGASRPRGTDGETHELLLLGVAGGVVSELGTGDLVLSSRYLRDTQSWDTSDLQYADSGDAGTGATSTGNVTTIKSTPESAPDITMIESALTPDSHMWELATKACVAGGPEANLVDSVTVDRVIGAPDHKRSIASTYPVGIVEMENYWVAELAAEYGVAFLAARVVLDTVDQALPGWLLGMTRSRFKAALSLALKPWRIPTVFRLARQRPVAQSSLTRFALKFLDQRSKAKAVLRESIDLNIYAGLPGGRDGTRDST
jgi:nucleoside phosphorylase